MKIKGLSHFVQISALNFLEYLRKLVIKLDRSKAGDEMPTSFKYDQDAKHAFLEAQLRRDLEWYRRKLRITPYWAHAHLRVGQISLDLNDIPSSYCAALAVNKLVEQGDLYLKAQHLLGKIYIRVNSFEQAVEVLEKLKTNCPNQVDVIEDLAAAYIGLSKFEKSYSLLSQLGQEKLTQEGLAAFQFLKQKLN